MIGVVRKSKIARPWTLGEGSNDMTTRTRQQERKLSTRQKGQDSQKKQQTIRARKQVRDKRVR
jgi:hypothetical protein